MKIHDVRVQRRAKCRNDHNFLNFKIQTKLQQKLDRPKNQEPGQDETTLTEIRQPQYNIKILEHDSAKDLYKNRLDQKI